MRKAGLKKRIVGGITKGLFFLSFLFSAQVPGLAQQMSVNPREELMLMTLNQLQEKEAFVRETVVDMQLKASQEKLLKQEVRKASPPLFKVETHPYFSSRVFFSDKKTNTDDRHSVVAFSNNSGLKMNFSGRDKYVNVDFAVSDNRDSQRSRDDLDSAEMNILANFIFENYTLSLSDSYFNNYIAGSDLGIQESEINYHWKNTFSSLLSSRFNRLDFNLGYERTDVNYKRTTITVSDEEVEGEEGVDYSVGGSGYGQDIFSVGTYFKVSPKTTLSFDYKHGRIYYLQKLDSGGDNYYHNYITGVSGVLSPKITASLGANYKLLHYRVNENGPKELGFSGELSYSISERTDLEFNYAYSRHRQSGGDNYYDQDSYTLSGNHRFAFNPKLKFSLACALGRTIYKKSEPSTKTKKDRSFIVGLSYAFRQWLDFSLSYGYKRYDYNYNDSDYGKNTVTFSTQARF